MSLLSLRTFNFRNLDNQSVPLDNPIVCLVGENGQGKTNFLEAIYYSCLGSSFKTNSDKEIIQYDQQSLGIETTFLNQNGFNEKLKIKLEKNTKSIFINEDLIRDRKEILTLNPCVVFCHEDINFVKGTPENRRWFFDHIQCIQSVEYINLFKRYKKALKIRNFLLREKKFDLLDLYSEELIRTGIMIQKERLKTINHFNLLFKELYSTIAELDNEVSLVYRNSWKSFNYDDIWKTCQAKLQKDIEQGFTSVGPHRDQYLFSYQEREFSQMASTGQQRLLALVLKVVQISYFNQFLDKKSILLFDDVLLELDENKRNNFLAMLPPREQVFFTFLPQDKTRVLWEDEALVYNVNKGKLVAHE